MSGGEERAMAESKGREVKGVQSARGGSRREEGGRKKRKVRSVEEGSGKERAGLET